MKSLVALVLASLALTTAAACSSPSPDDAVDDESAAQEGELRKQPNESQAAKSLWPKDGESFHVSSPGNRGFGPEPPAGSTCDLGAVKYDVFAEERTITMTRCVADEGEPLREEEMTRTLTVAQMKKAIDSLTQVKPTKIKSCDREAADEARGSHKPLLSLSVVSRSGGQKFYTDSFYFCMGDSRVYVDNIDQLFDTLGDLTPPAE